MTALKLYTRQGDDGSTGLIGNLRVRKDDARVNAYGEVDETNAAIGVAAVQCDDRTGEMLRHIQSDLFLVGAELATPTGENPRHVVPAQRASELEAWIDEASSAVEPLRNFVLPGGCACAAALHLARTVCRRAERAVVGLASTQAVRPEVVIYLNRLSDLLFALARRANRQAGVPDVVWHPPKPTSPQA